MLSPKANAVVKVCEPRKNRKKKKKQLDHVPYAPMTIDSIHLAPYLNTHHVWRKATQIINAEGRPAALATAKLARKPPTKCNACKCIGSNVF
jgi:hypothetical protein